MKYILFTLLLAASTLQADDDVQVTETEVPSLLETPYEE